MKSKIAYGGFLILNTLFFCVSHAQNDSIATVKGFINAKSLGVSLTHEHVMSNFGKPSDSTSFYDESRLMKQVVPYLKGLKEMGIHSIFDCTTAYFGRRIDLLEKISDASGVHIITNTGFYGSANDRYIPKFAYQLSPAELAETWTNEFFDGIEGTSVHPGFIKLAFDSGEPSEIDQKLVEAGIITHSKTGLTLAIHTGENIQAAYLTLKLLNEKGVLPNAWIWVHANKVTDDKILLEMAKKGAWISLDGVKADNVEGYVQRLSKFKKHDLLHKVLVSHDGNGFPAGGAIRQFDAIPLHLIPALKNSGFTQSEIDQLLIDNPRKAFMPSIKK
ncbi:phosphotriesterase family protein [Euzebyella saccharophila]|uniref:Phosphotriesterase n=1 Tax=Euzebyella saccharophila TaxID=679664 RepID=A0ABV8JJL3_9FLAO|nr:phosphotriesterase [Euzebyella saccharophila]